jgi:NAD(P)-dependent dehydrogenase (short-subunit alcohol dehydrogenase family)
MNIVIVGASGRIGGKVAERLSSNHDLIRVGARTGDLLCDYTDPTSISRLFEQTGSFDALIAVVGGDSVFKGYRDLVDEDYRFGFERKFLGQVRLVRIAERFVRDKGSFTLSSGFLSHYPNQASIATGPLNAAVDTFVQSTAPLASAQPAAQRRKPCAGRRAGKGTAGADHRGSGGGSLRECG